MKKYMMTIFSLAVGFGSLAASAAQLAPFRVAAGPSDRILIRGYRGEVTYIGVDEAREIAVEAVVESRAASSSHSGDWQFSSSKENGVINLKIDGPLSKAEWSEALQRGDAPQYKLKVIGPQIPLAVSWREGRISVQDLKNEVRITSLLGDVVIRGGVGDVVVSNQEGSVTVQGRKSKTTIDSYASKVSVVEVEGEIAVDNFAGDSRIEKAIGYLHLSSFKGDSRIVGGSGKFEFENGNAPLRIEGFAGEIRGKSGQGAVYAAIRGDADVRVESNEGSVHLSMQDSGAWLNLGTAEGQMAVPGNLKVTRLAAQQLRTGRLNKGSGGGNVFVRTQSGDIRVR